MRDLSLRKGIFVGKDGILKASSSKYFLGFREEEDEEEEEEE